MGDVAGRWAPTRSLAPWTARGSVLVLLAKTMLFRRSVGTTDGRSSGGGAEGWAGSGRASRNNPRFNKQK